MAVDDGNLDIGDLQDLISNNIEKEYSSWLGLSNFNDVPTSQLYVPPHSIHEMELEWFPSSPDDFISLNDVGLLPGYQTYFANHKQHEEVEAKHLTKEPNLNHKKDGIESLLQGFVGFTRKKRRTKHYQKPKWRVTWVKKRCSHCQAEETPQWREGPKGPKTLCNACGVRFKSGRLVTEYRPATSPTFDSHKHSNYHKKILKYRSTT
ncbi:GATA transcription factor 3-like [Abrus precatorius]|uniref:GATA transcription factor 3-like n=1 Tax=Abrus precatorius TaxID=3816 RepID=A0A8B8LY41_ABRPR|nr:GATA transcription factor 3-like [Abrus precatorius]